MRKRLKMSLHPLSEVLPQVNEWIARGATIYQQFNCAHCAAKQTMAEPNRIYSRGLCEECGGETDIEKDGCNYLVAVGITPQGLGRTRTPS